MKKAKMADHTAIGQGTDGQLFKRKGIKRRSKVPGVMITQYIEELPEGKNTPDFIRKPIALTIQEGKLAVFKAIVTGDPEPKVTWSRAKGEMNDPQKYQNKYNPTSREHTLEIPQVSGEEADTYKCYATNTFGKAVCTVVLNVIEVGFKKKKAMQQAAVPAEDPAEFRKLLRKSAGLKEVKKEGEIDEKVWELLLSADKKDYERICMEYGITDFRGMLKKLGEMKREREEAQARFIKQLSNLKHIEIKAEDLAQFELDLELKDPSSRIFLYKDGVMIPYSSEGHMEMKHSLRQVGKKYIFSIKNLRSEDAGLYQVDVEGINIFSTDFKIPSVEFLVKIEEVKATEREDALFECVISQPLPNICWIGKSIPLEAGEKYDITVSENMLIHRLLVKDCMPVDQGIYAAVAGISSCSAWLIVEADKDPSSHGRKTVRKGTVAGGSGKNLEQIAQEQEEKLKKGIVNMLDSVKKAQVERQGAGRAGDMAGVAGSAGALGGGAGGLVGLSEVIDGAGAFGGGTSGMGSMAGVAGGAGALGGGAGGLAGISGVDGGAGALGGGADGKGGINGVAGGPGALGGGADGKGGISGVAGGPGALGGGAGGLVGITGGTGGAGALGGGPGGSVGISEGTGGAGALGTGADGKGGISGVAGGAGALSGGDDGKGRISGVAGGKGALGGGADGKGGISGVAGGAGALGGGADGKGGISGVAGGKGALGGGADGKGGISGVAGGKGALGGGASGLAGISGVAGGAGALGGGADGKGGINGVAGGKGALAGGAGGVGGMAGVAGGSGTLSGGASGAGVMESGAGATGSMRGGGFGEGSLGRDASVAEGMTEGFGGAGGFGIGSGMTGSGTGGMAGVDGGAGSLGGGTGGLVGISGGAGAMAGGTASAADIAYGAKGIGGTGVGASGVMIGAGAMVTAAQGTVGETGATGGGGEVGGAGGSSEGAGGTTGAGGTGGGEGAGEAGGSTGPGGAGGYAGGDGNGPGKPGGHGAGEDGAGGGESAEDDAKKTKRGKKGTAVADTVTEAGVHFTCGLEDVKAVIGESAEMQCKVSKEDCKGVWYKDGKELSSSKGLTISKEGTVHKLKIQKVTEESAGKYRFEADGRKTEAVIVVEDPPRFDPKELSAFCLPITVKSGQNASFKVPFVGREPMKIKWYKNDEELSNDINVKLEKSPGHSRLLLSKLNRKDSGEIKVKIKNDFGTTEAYSKLIVLDKPTPPQGPLEILESSANSIEIKWRPPKDDGGTPVTNYNLERQQVGRNTWKKIGNVPGNPPAYRDADVDHGKRYCYRIRAITSQGISDMMETEDVQAGTKAYPGPPTTPKIVSAFKDCINLSWAAPTSTGGTSILGYNVEKRKKGSNLWSQVNPEGELIQARKYAVRDVVAGVQYEFRVSAVNVSGAGEPSTATDFVFARDPKKPPGKVVDLKVTDSSYNTLTLSWNKPIEKKGLNDEAKGYFVEIRLAENPEWHRCNTNPITTTTYTVKSLKSMAMYWVRVIPMNEGGEGKPRELDNYILAMPPPVRPRITDTKLKNFYVVRAGNATRININFEASPWPEITWLKDGFPVSKRITISNYEGNSQLLIPSAEYTDSGVYTIIIKNLVGQETMSVEIRVTDEPKPPGPVELEENVRCTVTLSWAPSPDEKHDNRLHYMVSKRDSNKRTWNTVGDHIFNNKFTVCNIMPGRVYNFRVYAKNDMGMSDPAESPPWEITAKKEKFILNLPESKECNLQSPPKFLVPLKLHSAPQGYECFMTCAVKGDPAPHVTWYYNNISLNSNSNYYITNTCGVCSMLILRVYPKDTGEYKVIAENALGRAESSTMLNVRE